MATTKTERPSTWSLLVQQIRYQNKLFWRTPIAAFFTLIFPLMMLVLFTAIFGNATTSTGLPASQFFAPNLAVFAAVSATYTNLAIGTAISRDNGILKRVRGTPLPPWLYVAGRVGSGVYVAAIAVIVMMGVGAIFYGVSVPWRGIPGAVLSFIVGVACFSALGLLIAALAPNGDSAPALTNATILPLAFVSDLFFEVEDPPRWMALLGDIFPLKHFAIAFRDPLNPLLDGLQIHWGRLAFMLAWGVVAFALALRFFRWEPSAGRSRRERRQKDG